jgi:hypothetical protein
MSAMPVLLLFSAVMKSMKAPLVVEGFAHQNAAYEFRDLQSSTAVTKDSQLLRPSDGDQMK